MCNYIVTEKEILNAEQDIFDNKEHFNAEQKQFIKCLDSCWLQAYAGTGKTSAIVGKLHVLAQKKVWQKGRGVCVISHTNVAVDEIKQHVAKHYPEIMQYPNFVGTIQEFANKFLFIPYLASKGLQIKFQDEMRYFDYSSELRDQAVINRIENKLKQLNHSNRQDARSDFFERLKTIHINDGKIFAKSANKGITEYTDLKTKTVSQDVIFNALSSMIQKQHNKGSFLFLESFIYGHEFLKKNTVLKDIINQRFQFVFLDEAQDCSEIQLKLLNELFHGKRNTVFQQVGDVNQSISEAEWKTNANPLNLSQSTRFGQNITSFINRFQTDTGQGVVGNSTEIKKILILYEIGKEKVILSEFAKKLKDLNIPFDPKKGYFAISHKHEQLEQYFEDYSKGIAKRKNKKKIFRFDNDIEYLFFLNKSTIEKYGTNMIWNILFYLLFKHYRENNNSWGELKDLLRNGDKAGDFRELVIKIVMEILQNGEITDLNTLKDKLNDILGESKVDFSSVKKSSLSNSEITSENKYTDSIGLDVNVGTIHSVKGQTHNATLFYSNKEHGKQDLQHTLDNTQSHTPAYKKLLYVASSRAQSLFAFAIAKTEYDSLTDNSMFQDFDLINIQ